MKMLWFYALIIVLGLGCGKKQASQAGSGGGAPVPTVVVTKAVRERISENLALVGSILANEMVEIRPEAEGIVAEILFEEGSRVKKGDLLVRLDERELQATLAEAEANHKLSRSTFERSKQLFADKLISQQEFDQAASGFQSSQAAVEVKRQQLGQLRVYAPFNGIISARNISPGQVVNRATALTVLVDMDPVKVELNVPERYISRLAVGQELQLKVAAFEEEKFIAKVYFISPDIHADTRTALVKALAPNPGLKLKPGMFANAQLTLQVRDNAIVIPESGIAQVLDQDAGTVFIVTPDNTVVPKKVKLGVRLPGKVEVTEGLVGNERVIVEGVQKVVPGGKVNFSKGS